MKLIAMSAGVALVLIVGAMTAMYSQQAYAQAKPTSLTLGAYPNKGKVGATTGTLPVSLFGKLTSEGSDVGGASITLEQVKVLSISQLTNSVAIALVPT